MSESPKGTLETVLVVDDDPAVLALVSKILADADFRALTARDGAEAVALAVKTADRINLLLSDVDMPLMSGQTWAST